MTENLEHFFLILRHEIGGEKKEKNFLHYSVCPVQIWIDFFLCVNVLIKNDEI